MRSLMIGLMLLIFSANASAVLIHGDIFWGGEYSRTGDVYSFSNVEIDNATGDFAAAGISDGDILAPNPFNRSSFMSGVHWVLAGFSYQLNSINVVFDNFGTTVFVGTGTMSHANFDPTHYQFRLTANTGSNPDRGNFSASAVPEPGSLILFGSGIVGLLYLRRRKTAKHYS